MVIDNQVKKLRTYLQQGKSLDLAAAKSGMDPKTARKYRAMASCPVPSGQNRFVHGAPGMIRSSSDGKRSNRF